MFEKLKNFEKDENNLWWVIFGIIIFFAFLVRMKWFFLNIGLHCDEANLALNLFDNSYLELFLPLDRIQVAPPLFMVLSKFVYNLVYLHYTPDFSDMVLRLVPFAAGLIAVPLFGYLVYSIYKNNFLTALGMSILAFSPPVIAYSVTFKHYSLEVLVTIILLLIFVKLDYTNLFSKKNILSFLGVIICLYCSMTSAFILFGCVVYLLYQIVKTKQYNKLGLISLIILTVFLLYLKLTILPVYTAHGSEMNNFWHSTSISYFSLKSYIYALINYIYRDGFHLCNSFIIAFAFVYLFIFGLLKDRMIFCLTVLPVMVLFVFQKFDIYPNSERLLLFIFPVVIISFFYILKDIVFKNRIIYFAIIAVSIIMGFYNTCGDNELVAKQEPSRSAWQYLNENINEDTVIFFGNSYSSNLYYSHFYPNLKINNSNVLGIVEHDIVKDRNVSSKFKQNFVNLKSGKYCIIFTREKSLAMKYAKYIKARSYNYKEIEIVPYCGYENPESENAIIMQFEIK